MIRPGIVFFTYTRFVPTAQMGVFKRCIRLMGRLADELDIHLVNYGPLPNDPLFEGIRPRIRVLDPPGDDLGPGLTRMLARIAPRAVVLGEAPLRGSMRISHRAATSLGIWQVCIDNHYGDFVERRFPSEWPSIDRWLLLGLPRMARAVCPNEKIVTVPPLVQVQRPAEILEPDRVCLIAYDRNTLFTATQMLEFLPPSETIDLVAAPGGKQWLSQIGFDFTRPGLRLLTAPDDAELCGSMARAKFVFGKAGFQQIVESIALGAPILCRLCGGGVDESVIPPHLRPNVRFIGSGRELPNVMFDLADWLIESPLVRWPGLPSDPIAHAADALRGLALAGGRPGATRRRAPRARAASRSEKARSPESS